MFLLVFAVLVAHNTEAESSSNGGSVDKDHSLTIAIPTAKPEETIAFYKKLGFSTVPGLTGELDMVRMERKGTPYKLEICHNRFSEAGPVVGGVSGLSFAVEDLSSKVEQYRAKGLSLSAVSSSKEGASCASLKDPNGITIKLIER
jgi:predicted enzyme related to lactoylglutathione lyase